MHEVGIAQNIIEIIEKEARQNNSGAIKKVKLLIGEFTNVVKEALEFAFEIVKKNSLAENAEFEIEMVKLKTYCAECDTAFNGKEEANFICPHCSGFLEIVEGKEMKIEYIDVE